MKHELASISPSGRGSIVNAASIYGFKGGKVGVAPYVASKHAVIGMTKAAPLEYAKIGVCERRLSRIHLVGDDSNRSGGLSPISGDR
jgi:NADP-dependent 3-hydroxy acid dehydrogenase YdfG